MTLIDANKECMPKPSTVYFLSLSHSFLENGKNPMSDMFALSDTLLQDEESGYCSKV